MCKGNRNIKSAIGLDTLAQSGTDRCCHSKNEDDFVLNESTKSSSKDKLYSRAKRKYISRSLSLNMIDYIKTLDQEIGKEKREEYTKSFWNMFHCVSTLEKVGNKITGKYCKNRMCMVCNSIRQAQNMNKYIPVLKEWNDMKLVTLTVPNVSKADLRPTIIEMNNIFTGIKDFLNKRHRRGKCNKFVGIKKLECTFSVKHLDYHPHFHFIIKDPETAELLVSEWLKRTIGTTAKAQDIRAADVKSSKELFKYFTKVSTKVKTGSKSKSYIYLDSLFVQFVAFRKLRTFSKFGFKLPVSEELKETEYSLELDDSNDGQVYQDYYVWNSEDWFSIKTGDCLTSHRADKRSKNVLNSIKSTHSVYD